MKEAALSAVEDAGIINRESEAHRKVATEKGFGVDDLRQEARLLTLKAWDYWYGKHGRELNKDWLGYATVSIRNGLRSFLNKRRTEFVCVGAPDVDFHTVYRESPNQELSWEDIKMLNKDLSDQAKALLGMVLNPPDDLIALFDLRESKESKGTWKTHFISDLFDFLGLSKYKGYKLVREIQSKCVLQLSEL